MGIFSSSTDCPAQHRLISPTDTTLLLSLLHCYHGPAPGHHHDCMVGASYVGCRLLQATSTQGRSVHMSIILHLAAAEHAAVTFVTRLACYLCYLSIITIIVSIMTVVNINHHYQDCCCECWDISYYVLIVVVSIVA